MLGKPTRSHSVWGLPMLNFVVKKQDLRAACPHMERWICWAPSRWSWWNQGFHLISLQFRSQCWCHQYLGHCWVLGGWGQKLSIPLLCTPQMTGRKPSAHLVAHRTGFSCTTKEKGRNKTITPGTLSLTKDRGARAKGPRPEWSSQLTWLHRVLSSP